MGQQALNRKPNLSVRRRLQLDANTEIAEIGITVRKQMELTNNKSLTDVERGMHLMAAKILVNGQPIVYDDLMDGFTTEEMDKITEFLFPDAKKEVERDISKNGYIIRKSKCSTDFKRNDFLKKNEAYPLGALRSLKFAYRKLRISLFVELAV